MTFVAEIKVMPLKELLDPQGKAVLSGLHNLGMKEVNDVRIGKHLKLTLEANDREQAEALIVAACKKLLANPVMEVYEFILEEQL